MTVTRILAPDQAIPAWVDGRLTACDKLDVHLRGLRHPAVSVFVLRGTGAGREVLLQQRAAGKYHTPGLWANTCCTHPHWGEAPADCARRRLEQELGIAGLGLRPAGQVEYRADVGGGMIEHEVVDLFVAEAGAELPVTPDPAEVQAVAWVPVAALTAAMAEHPDLYTPWLRIYLARHGAMILDAKSPGIL